MKVRHDEIFALQQGTIFSLTWTLALFFSSFYLLNSNITLTVIITKSMQTIHLSTELKTFKATLNNIYSKFANTCLIDCLRDSYQCSHANLIPSRATHVLASSENILISVLFCYFAISTLSAGVVSIKRTRGFYLDLRQTYGSMQPTVPPTIILIDFEETLRWLEIRLSIQVKSVFFCCLGDWDWLFSAKTKIL